MKKHLGVFIIFFGLGAVIAAIIRAATYHPPSQTSHMSPAEHAAHTMAPVTATMASVNSTCPICAMPVNPAIPFADYKGVKIGFGCTACPPKFAVNPTKYGEAALKNQVVE